LDLREGGRGGLRKGRRVEGRKRGKEEGVGGERTEKQGKRGGWRGVLT